MGHTIDKLGYDKSHTDLEHYLRKYLRALPWLEILSSPRPYNHVPLEDVEVLREELKSRDRPYEKMLEDIFQLQNTLASIPEGLAALKRLSSK